MNAAILRRSRIEANIENHRLEREQGFKIKFVIIKSTGKLKKSRLEAEIQAGKNQF